MNGRIDLFLGPENGQKQDAIDKIRDSLNKEFNNEVDYSKYYAFEDSNEQLFLDLNNDNIFSQHSLIILSDIDKLKAPDVASILKYIEHPMKNNTLILTSDVLSLKSPASKIGTKLKKSTTVFWGLQENQLFGWVKSFFQKNNFQIDNNATQYIIDQTDNNTSELEIICNQLAFFFYVNKKTDTISEDDIETFVNHNKSEDAFTLFAAIAAARLEDSLEIAIVILERDNTSRYILIPGLLWAFRRLLSVSSFISQGDSSYQAFAKANVLEKTNAIRSKKDQSVYTSALRNYSFEDLNRIIKVLLEADIEIRSASTDTLQIYVERLIYTIIVKKGKVLEKFKTASFKQKL